MCAQATADCVGDSECVAEHRHGMRHGSVCCTERLMPDSTNGEGATARAFQTLGLPAHATSQQVGGPVDDISVYSGLIACISSCCETLDVLQAAQDRA